MQVISGRGAVLGGYQAGAMLVDDHAAQARGAVGNPEDVSDTHLQFVRGGRWRILNLHVAPGPLQRSSEA